MSRFSRISLYILFLLAEANFFSPSFPAWRWTAVISWKWCLAAAVFILGWEFLRGKKWTKLTRPGWRSPLFLLVFVLGLVLLVHLPQLVNRYAHLNADTDMQILVARNIASGSRPIYLYSQFYQGATIAYFYHLVHYLVRDLRAAVQLVNWIFFSLGAFLWILILRRNFSSTWPLLFLGTLLLANSELMANDTIHGFPLAFCLLAFMVYALSGILFSAKRGSFWLGAAAGLLFFQYQQALLFALLLLAAVILLQPPRLRENIWKIPAGFLAGAFPFLLAELYNRLLTTQSLFLSKAGTLPGISAAAKNAAAHFVFHPLSLDRPPLASVFLLLFAGGFAFLLYEGIQKKKRRALLLPAIYLAAVILGAASGVAPDNPRFEVHFRLFTPLALYFAALPLALAWRLLRRARSLHVFAGLALAVFLAAWAGLNGGRAFSGYGQNRRMHRLNRQIIGMLSEAPARIIAGDYWFVKKFQSYLEGERTVLVASSASGPWLYRTPGFYPPDGLLIAGAREEGSTGYLTARTSEAALAKVLRTLKLKFKLRRAGVGSLFYGFRPEPPLEILHLLSLAERDPVRVDGTLAALPRPWEEIGGIECAGDRLRFTSAATTVESKVYTWFQLQMMRDGYSLEMPLVFRKGRMEWRLPDGTQFSGGEWELVYKWKCLPLHRERRLVKQSGPTAPALLRSDLADLQHLFFTARSEKRLARAANLACMQLQFAALPPSDRLFLGVENEIMASGAVPETGVRLQPLDGRIRALKVTLVSILDFESMSWSRRFRQCLEIRRDPPGKPETLPLATGLQEVTLAARPGETLAIVPRYAAVFGGEDSAENDRLFRTGLLLFKIACLDESGKTLGEISPWLALANPDRP